MVLMLSDPPDLYLKDNKPELCLIIFSTNEGMRTMTHYLIEDILSI